MKPKMTLSTKGQIDNMTRCLLDVCLKKMKMLCWLSWRLQHCCHPSTPSTVREGPGVSIRHCYLQHGAPRGQLWLCSCSPSTLQTSPTTPWMAAQCGPR